MEYICWIDSLRQLSDQKYLPILWWILLPFFLPNILLIEQLTLEKF